MRNKFYLNELQHFDGEDTVLFHIVDLNTNSAKIFVAVTKVGKTSVREFDLFRDDKGLYFEYGVAGTEHIHLDDFENVDFN